MGAGTAAVGDDADRGYDVADGPVGQWGESWGADLAAGEPAVLFGAGPGDRAESRPFENVPDADAGALAAGAPADVAGASGGPVPAARASYAVGRTGRVAGIVLGTTLAIAIIISATVSFGVGHEGSPDAASGAAGTWGTASPSREGTVDAPAEAAGADLIPAVQAPEGWENACVDAYGNPTVYALTELSGERLSGLLGELGYEWVDESRAWGAGHAALCAFDGEGEDYLDADEVAELDPVSGAAAYQIATRDYATAEEAYLGLVARSMTSEDSEFSGDAGIGVAYGASMVEYLVEVIEGDDHVSLYVFGPGSLRAGLFDSLAKGSFGDTARDAFAAVTGREPGATS